MSKPKNELLVKAVEAAKTSTFDKTKASFTFDKKLFSEFQSFCKAQDIPQSRMLEELMRALLQDTKTS